MSSLLFHLPISVLSREQGGRREGCLLTSLFSPALCCPFLTHLGSALEMHEGPASWWSLGGWLWCCPKSHFQLMPISAVQFASWVCVLNCRRSLLLWLISWSKWMSFHLQMMPEGALHLTCHAAASQHWDYGGNYPAEVNPLHAQCGCQFHSPSLYRSDPAALQQLPAIDLSTSKTTQNSLSL